MKNLAVILFIGLLFSSCGSNKEVVATSPKTTKVVVVTEIPSEVKKEIKDSTATEKPLSTIKESLKAAEEKVIEIPLTTEIFNHTAWNLLLKENVSNDGRVNYEGFRQSKGELHDYITSLGANTPLESWGKDDKLAYWMNAYNAMTVDLILRNLPLQSIKEINKPWDQRLWKLNEKWYNLNEIEHQILRKMEDPRIHFGINCASFSCPPLLNEAFTSKTVQSQLDQLAKSFVNDTKRNTISENSIQISKIFSWFSKDFKSKGSLIDFLNTYSKVTISPKARKSYKTYNWSLNN